MPDQGDHDAAIQVITMGGMRTQRCVVRDGLQRWREL